MSWTSQALQIHFIEIFLDRTKLEFFNRLVRMFLSKQLKHNWVILLPVRHCTLMLCSPADLVKNQSSMIWQGQHW